MRLFFVLLISLVCFSCGKEPLVGLCDSPFVIKVDPVILEGEEKVFLVHVEKGDGWWLDDVSINGESDSLDINSLVNKKSYIIVRENYSFEKVNSSRIIIRLKKGEDENPIELKVGLQSGNCFGGFIIK